MNSGANLILVMRKASYSGSLRASLRMIALFGVEVASLLALHYLGDLSFLAGPGLSPATWGPWLAQTAPADALASVTRLVAMGLAAWLLGSTTLYALARVARAPWLLRTARFGTPAAVRRLVDRALAMSLA